jgi:hypothetical protein
MGNRHILNEKHAGIDCFTYDVVFLKKEKNNNDSDNDNEHPQRINVVYKALPSFP